MNLAEFAIKQRLLSFLVIIISLCSGYLAYNNMARFEDPEFTIRTALVITQYPGASPEEVANEVTETLESAIQQLQEVEEIRSISSAGLSRISVDIKYEFSPTKSDLAVIWSKLRNRVADAGRMLPPGASEPIVNDDFGDVYGLYYLLTGPGFTDKEMAEYAKDLRTDLLSVRGVAKVLLQGIQQETIYIEISRERANALGISVEGIFADLAQQNTVADAGSVYQSGRRLIFQPKDEIDSVESIKNIVVSVDQAGTLLRLGDVASVRRGYQEPQQFLMRYNGDPAIGLGVSNVTGGNIVEVGKAIDRKLAEVTTERPIGMELHEYYHQGKIVEASVSDFVLNVALALVIVLVTLLLFMGARSAIVIGAVLLLTVAATLATMQFFAIPMHRISLGALIIALGMLVDNAIVVTEGILVGIQRGRKKLDISKEIVTRTKWPLLGGTAVGIVAFAPIGFAAGSTAEYTQHLFWVVLISLFYSWIFALTAVPLFADMLFKEEANQEAKPTGRLMRSYRSFMANALRWRWVVVGISVGLFVLSIWSFQFVKPGFFPASTTPQIVVDYWLPEGTDIRQTQSDMSEIEAVLAEYEGISDIQTLIGAGTLRYMLVYEPEAPNAAYGQFLLKVTDYELIDDLLPKIQDMINANYPDSQAKVWRFQLGPGGGSKVEAMFSGPDRRILRDLAEQAKAIYAADGGAIAIKDDWRQPVALVQPIYSEIRGRRIGVSRDDLANALATNYSGRAIGVYREEDSLIPIVARAPESERMNLGSLVSIPISTSKTENAVPLLEVVDRVETIWRDSQIRRTDRVWSIKAQADPLPPELPADLLGRVQASIEDIPLPPGYSLEWKGEIGESSEAQESLAATLPVGLLVMVLIVVVLFNSIRQPLLIWFTVPLALIGVVLGLLVTNTALEFMAILGLLSLSGLLIKNAIVLVDQMDLEISQGKPRFDAVVDSAASRARPVLMGSLTTVLGVLPLLEDAFFKSMAVVLIFGLTFATMLTLVIIPSLYAIFFNVRTEERAK